MTPTVCETEMIFGLSRYIRQVLDWAGRSLYTVAVCDIVQPVITYTRNDTSNTLITQRTATRVLPLECTFPLHPIVTSGDSRHLNGPPLKMPKL